MNRAIAKLCIEGLSKQVRLSLYYLTIISEIQPVMRILFFAFLLLMPFVSTGHSQGMQAAQAISKGFEAIRAKDWPAATAAVRPAGKTGKDLVDWHRLRASAGKFPEYQNFLDTHTDWPGLPLLRKRGEPTIPKDADADQVITYFKDAKPRTGVGVLRLARAFEQHTQKIKAAEIVVAAWRTMKLTDEERAVFLETYDALLRPHHQARVDMLLWNGRTKEAGSLLNRLSPDWQALAKARIALRRKADTVDTLIKAVPEPLANDAGLAYERFLWRVRKGRPVGAAEIILARSKSVKMLGDPMRWAERRRVLARLLMRSGDGLTAYRIASSHYLVGGSKFADLEWLSGYLALRYLNDPKTALAHFQSFRAAVVSPISMGRAGYWEGRAYEAMGDSKNAQTAYAFAGEYQSSFYGQLAAEKAGLKMYPRLLGDEVFPDWRGAAFMKSSVLESALLLYAGGEKQLAKRFFLQVAETLDRTELGQLADLVFSLNDPHIAVMIAKQGARRGEVIDNAYFPLHPLATMDLPVETELAMAIARRETEFNAALQSPVGAQGLMQLMPRTAKSVAEELEIEYDADLLLNDWAYNARLGSTYLARLQSEFGKSPVLVAAGYNAGPSRSRAWSNAFGDPRDEATDVIDWIEHIPFRETRNYVMRVAESLPIYRARLSGKLSDWTVLQDLKAGK